MEGNENYKYAYGYSRVSPLGPFIFPEQDIISQTDHDKGIFGPGHGCVFSDDITGQHYFTYLEFGNGSTNRQVWIDKLEFNEDGTIKPVELTHTGVNLPGSDKKEINRASGKKAVSSSVLPELIIKPISDSLLQRMESYHPGYATDGSNRTRWMADSSDTESWFTVDLGEPVNIKRTEAYFVMPTIGHAYQLSYSIDGIHWKICGGHNDVRIQSPHVDKVSVKARFLKVKVLKGISGLWEFKVY
jgi:hypothetical protein